VPTARARVLRAAEEAKKQLSVAPFAEIQEEYIAEKDGIPLHLTMEIARHEFESLVRPLLDKTITCVGQALDDAKLSPFQLDRVLLVGGSTRSPIVTEMLEERLDQPAHQEVDPDLCVALGAAIQAAIINGQDIGPVLVDITPHSLGIRCLGTVDGLLSDSMFSRIITRNSPLPISRSEGYQTVVDGQETVEIEVYQGEYDDARMNTLVGEFLVEGLADVPAGNEVLVHMTLTLDGILQVTATEKQTGLQRQVRIENALTRFQHDVRDEAQRRLDALFADDEDEESTFDVEFQDIGASEPEPSEAATDAKIHRAVVQARALIEKAERLLPSVDDVDKADVESLLAQLRDAINTRNTSAIEAHSDELADMLFYMEDV
jgi:molecular chaperone DnaK